MEQQTEHYEEMEEADDETSRTCTSPPTPQNAETKKIKPVHKQQQHTINIQESLETTEKEDCTDMEPLLSDDPENLQETSRSSTLTTLKDKTIIADHKAIDVLCTVMKEQGKQPIAINTFSHFLKACRRQKDPKLIANEHTTNIIGLINMLEENMCSTKDYNLRRRMKRIVDI
jgi:hypothetical protein